MEGHRLIVEMKNDSEIEGILEESDGFMNLHMKDVKFTFPNGKRIQFDESHIRGTSIRFIQLPSDVNPVAVIKKQLTVKKKAPPLNKFKV